MHFFHLEVIKKFLSLSPLGQPPLPFLFDEKK
jgi:hypothetical protein